MSVPKRYRRASMVSREIPARGIIKSQQESREGRDQLLRYWKQSYRFCRKHWNRNRIYNRCTIRNTGTEREWLLQSLRNAYRRRHVLDVVASDLLDGQRLAESTLLLVVPSRFKAVRISRVREPTPGGTSLRDQLATDSSRHLLMARS